MVFSEAVADMSALPSGSDCWIVAHRGVSDRCPENTRAAFLLALQQQADAIECDLQVTADGQIVVCHDEHLGRYGHPGVRLADATWQELQSLDVGSWYHSDFADQKLLTLDQLLDDFGSQCSLMLEIKNVPEDPVMAQKFYVNMIHAITVRSLQCQVAILCFDIHVLEKFQQLAPWAVCVLNIDRPSDLSLDDLQRYRWLRAVDSNIKNLHSADVSLFRQHQLVPMSYTCNSESEILKAWTMGVAAIITNDPERTRNILAKIIQSHAA